MRCIFGSRADLVEHNLEKHDITLFLIQKKPFVF